MFLNLWARLWSWWTGCPEWLADYGTDDEDDE